MARKEKTIVNAARLSEEEVRERLHLCENSEIVDEIYETGQDMVKETKERIQSLESKATTFAAYGTAIVTLLVSTASAWFKLGNECSLWIAFSAAVCGLICTVFCVQALSLRAYEVPSEDEWLDRECLTQRIEFLKRYRILTMWGTMDSHIAAQAQKAGKLQRAETWLTGSVACLVFLLFQLSLIRSRSDAHWLPSWQGTIHHHLWFSGWQYLTSRSGVLGDWCCALILALILALTYWRSRSF